MAGTFMVGEQKVRPGSYFNIQKKEKNPVPGIINGVTAVIFKADFGPLGTCVELNVENGDIVLLREGPLQWLSNTNWLALK